MKVEDQLFHKNKGFDKENAHEIIGTLKIISTWYLTKPAQNVTFNHQFQIHSKMEKWGECRWVTQNMGGTHAQTKATQSNFGTFP